MTKFSLVILALILVAAGAVLYQQRPTSRISARPTATAVLPSIALPTRTPPIPTVAANRDVKVTVELSEQEVNDLLRDGLAQRGYLVDDLVVRLEDGRFVATTTQQVAFFRVPVTVVGEVTVVDGQVAVHPTSVNAAGASVPQDVSDQLSGALRSVMGSAVDDLPLRLTRLQIQRGKIIVEGLPK